ncbi:TolC family protein [Taibaiella chishuiensis]|uniref:Outer membrane protein TolC n=1 Tax=Taibaiella chishuiensis TaxID=1434707 RepID=A0A2P8D8H5_9BACT|nr:TolC family protein [Taibaiella chishuiensis]PSK93509.1 outer membrane protein TolC [Taibaiella chishuiensis]
MKTKVIRYGLLFLLLVLEYYSRAQAATSFSLEQAVQYGVQHHPNIRKSDYELDKYNQKFREALSGYLPQVKADAAYTRNLQLITQIIPGEFMGKPGQDAAVQFGTKYNGSANIDVSQTLLDFEKISDQQIAKQQARIGLLDKQKTTEQIIYDIGTAYNVSQVAFLQQQDINGNLYKTDSLIAGTQSRLDNGFAQVLDLKRLQLERSNLQTQLQNARLAYEQGITLLKYTMAFPLEQALYIDTLARPALTQERISGELPANPVALQLLTARDQVTELSRIQMQRAYLPKLSVNFKYGLLAQQNDPNLFRANTTWYPNSLVSIKLSLPVFDGNYTDARIKQLRLEHRQNQLDIVIQQNTVAKELRLAKDKLIINTANRSSTAASRTLAEEVYALSYIQYKNGYTTLKELLDNQTAVRNAQKAYLEAILEEQSARLELLKASGNLQSLLP